VGAETVNNGADEVKFGLFHEIEWAVLKDYA
jgi:hypothetical protein